MSPTKVILPAAENVNPVAIVDCGAASLSDVLGYCSRILGWSHALLPMGRDKETRGVMAKIGDLMAEEIEACSLERNIDQLPDGVTIRRIIIGNGVLATISQQDGTVLDNAIEAVNAANGVALASGLFEDDDDWDDDEFEDELDDIDDEEEDEEEEYDDEEEDEEPDASRQTKAASAL